MNLSALRRRNNCFTITNIGDNSYLVEGNLSLKIGCEIDPVIDYVDIFNGPFIQRGRDFLGKGSVIAIDIIQDDPEIIIKVSLNEQAIKNKK